MRRSPGRAPDDPRPGPLTPAGGRTARGWRAAKTREPAHAPWDSGFPASGAPQRPGDSAVALRVRARGAPRPPVRVGSAGMEFQEGGLEAAPTGRRAVQKPRRCGAGRSAPGTPGGARRPKFTISPPEAPSELWEAPGSLREPPEMRGVVGRSSQADLRVKQTFSRKGDLLRHWRRSELLNLAYLFCELRTITCKRLK